MKAKKTPRSTFAVARLEDEVSGIDVVRISFEKTGARGEGYIVEPRSILDDANRLWQRLGDAGAPRDGWTAATLRAELDASIPARAGSFYRLGGWKQAGDQLVFVLGDSVIGNVARASLYAMPLTPVYAGSNSGTLERWQSEVASLAFRSQYASVILLASLAAPLRYFAKEVSEGLLFNLAGVSVPGEEQRGNSSTGKTTSQFVAASVWGDPKQLPTWDSSPRALSEGAASLCDIAMVVDDTDQNSKLPPEKRMDAMFDAANHLVEGRGRNYSATVALNLIPLSFRCMCLSSSTRSIEGHLKMHGRPRQDSDRARLLELLVPHSKDGGIWRGSGLDENTAVLSSQLRAAAESNYGCAGRAWIDALIGRHARLREEVSALIARFIARAAPTEIGVRARIAAKVGLLYAAGILASRSRVIMLRRGQAMKIAEFAYGQALEAAFTRPPTETVVRELIDRVCQLPSVLRVANLGEVPDDLVPEVIEVPPLNRLFIKDQVLRRAWPGRGRDGRSYSWLKAHLTNSGVWLDGHGSGGRTIRLGKRQRQVRYIAFDLAKLSALAGRSPCGPQ